MTSIITRIKCLFSRLLYLSFLLLIPVTHAETIELVANINVNLVESDLPKPSSLTLYNGEVYFAYTDAKVGRELFAYNQTTGETRLVADINPHGSSSPSSLSVENNKLYFYATNEANERKRYEYDSTTSQIKISEHPLHGFEYDGFKRLDNIYYYWVNDSGSSEIYSLDIETNVTRFVKRVPVSIDRLLYIFGDQLIIPFSHVLYAYNDTDGLKTVYVDDTVCEDDGGCANQDVLTIVGEMNDKFYFTDGSYLIAYDIANESVNIVTGQGCPAEWYCDFEAFVNDFEDKIFFFNYSYAEKEDVVKVYDTSTLELYSFPRKFDFDRCYSRDRFYCVDENFDNKGLAVYFIDFDNKVFTPLASIVLPDYRNRSVLSYLDNAVYFTQSYHGDLFVYNTETEQVKQVTFQKVRDASSNPHDLSIDNNQLLFTANDGDSDKRFTFDGETEQLTVIGDADQISIFNCANQQTTEYNGKFYFSYSHELYGEELFYCDALDSEAPKLAVDLNPGAASSSPKGMIVYDNQLYFWANDGVHGKEIMRFDSESFEAQLVADFNGGSKGTDVIPDKSGARFNIIDNKLIFAEARSSTIDYSVVGAHRFTQFNSVTGEFVSSSTGDGALEELVPYGNGFYFVSSSYFDNGAYMHSDRTLTFYNAVENMFTFITSRGGFTDPDYNWIGEAPCLDNIFIFDNKVFYSAADNDELGNEVYRLYQYDVNTEQKYRVGEEAYGTKHVEIIDNKLYIFHDYERKYSTNVKGLYVVNTQNNKVRQLDVSLSFTRFSDTKLAYQQALYFSADDGVTGYELYRLLPNQTPVIEGNTSFTFTKSTESQLSSLTAFDADNDELTFFWQQTAGTLVDLDDATSDAPLFTTPNVSQDETLVFELTVSDGLDDAIQQVTVLVKVNQPPTVSIANAGTMQTRYQEGEQLQLSALATDADNDVLTYQWQQLSGPSITLTNANEENVTITLPQVQANAAVEMQVTVFDGELSASAVVSFTINNVEEPAKKSSGGGAMQWLLVLLWIMAFRRTRLL